MAHFLRGKQAGVQNDLSNGVAPELFLIDDFARYGINSQLSAFAYDPVQSLLAVGTSESQFGAGLIYVFGQKRVCVTLSPPRKSSVRRLQFCGDKLIALDSKNDVCVFSLDTGKTVASYAPPGFPMAMVSDPSLDYCLIGLQSGEIVAFDLDRESSTPFKIPNFWRDRNPRARLLPVVSLQFHPKDIGTLLIGYSEGAVIYSFKQNKPMKYFQYEVPSGAPGGDCGPSAANEIRRPRLTHAIWHPTGTFVLTAHEDSSLVFWDPKDGRTIEARTLKDTGVNTPGKTAWTGSVEEMSLKRPYFHISWCSKENPDDTGLLIAGGTPTTDPTKGLTFFDLGHTPNYQTSSWDILTQHFRSPKHIHVIPTPPGAEIADLLLIPRSSPHFAGSHDPIALLALLSSGEIITLSFPSGHPITPTNLLHVSLSFVHPFVTKIALTYVDRNRWLGMREYRQHGPNFLMGGAEQTKALKRYENRNIVQTAHADGVIRIWDAGHGDEIENSVVVQVDIARAVGRWDDVEVTQMSMSGATGEISVGLRSGEVVIFRLGRNQNAGRPPLPAGQNEGPGKLTNITNRADPGLKEGLLPLTMTNDKQGPVTALNHSDVGFVVFGYQSGSIVVVDLRGPAIIYTTSLADLTRTHRRGSIKGTHLRGNDHGKEKQEFPTVIEYGVMTVEGDDYSSHLFFVGTSIGRVATFKILPASGGTFTVALAGIATLDARMISISPINSETGAPAAATQSAVAALKTGKRTSGVLVAVTASSAHIFRPASAKGAHKSFDEFFCDAATVARFEDRGYAIVGLFGDGRTRAFSIPALKEIGSARVDQKLDVKRFGDAIISPTGDILGWTGPSEIAILNVWGTGLELMRSGDKLYNAQATIPPRPTISNLQWIAGTQYITATDMDLLIGGPNRPPSKRMLAEMREADLAAQNAGGKQPARRAGTQGSTSSADAADQEGYWAYMQRQVQERTERLGIAGDNMDRAAESSSDWSDSVSKYVAKQKRSLVLGAISSKFGL